MKQLSGLDAGFLSLETDAAPMSIGGLSILDPETPDGRLDVHRLRQVLRPRLAGVPAFYRRLATTPLDLTRPYWVDLDPDEVDLEAHVQHTVLPEPGGWRELSELMAFEMSRRLPRDRPLWEILFVDGLDRVAGAPQGAVALIGRAHHAAVDGVSGAEILAALYEPVDGAGSARRSAERAASREAADGSRRTGEPGTLELLASMGRDLASAPLELPRAAGRSLLGVAGSALARLAPGPAPPSLYSAPRTPLNHPIGRERSWAPAFFDLDRIKAVKNAAGATVNDVVLAVCAGALRGWLEAGGELPAEPLVAMVPVSVRGADERRAGGNLLSAMLVSLATDEPDPRRRLERIREQAQSAKKTQRAVGARTLMQSAELLPFALSGLGVRLYSRLHLADRARPPFNLVITNVPGPPMPLAVAGARLLAYAGSAPLFDGLGLILPVFSYAGRVSIGVTAARRVMPRPAAFAERLEAALDELESAVGGTATRA